MFKKLSKITTMVAWVVLVITGLIALGWAVVASSTALAYTFAKSGANPEYAFVVLRGIFFSLKFSLALFVIALLFYILDKVYISGNEKRKKREAEYWERLETKIYEQIELAEKRRRRR